MEQLFGKFDQISHGVISKGFLMSFQWIDWVVLGFVLWGLIHGTRNGLMREIVLVFENVVIVYVIFHYYGPMANGLQSQFPVFSKVYADMIAYLLILIGMFIAMRLIDALILSNCLQIRLAAPLRLVGGGFLGMVHFLIILSLLCQALLLLPIASVQKVFERRESRYGQRVSKLSPDVYERVQSSIRFVAGQWQRFAKTVAPSPSRQKAA